MFRFLGLRYFWCQKSKNKEITQNLFIRIFCDNRLTKGSKSDCLFNLQAKFECSWRVPFWIFLGTNWYFTIFSYCFIFPSSCSVRTGSPLLLIAMNSSCAGNEFAMTLTLSSVKRKNFIDLEHLLKFSQSNCL